jgi:ketosteroid isomerase-like protein
VSDPEVELAYRWGEVFDGGDAVDIGEVLHSDVVWHPVEVNHAAVRGLEAAHAIRSQWHDSFDEHSVTIEEVIKGSDGLVSVGRAIARGRSSGVEVDLRLYMHHRFRDGKIVYIYEYQDRDEALAAAGAPREGS